MNTTSYTTLFRPVGPEELSFIEKSGWKRFPPRLPGHPVFCPVMNGAYAIQIARDWNGPASGSGFVTKFTLPTDFLEKYQIQNVGGPIHNDLGVPAEEPAAFNDHIVGEIEVAQSFYPE